MTAPHQDLRVIDAATEALAELRQLCTSLTSAIVLTDDGFEVVRMPDRGTRDGRFAGMASSIQALSDAVARESRIGDSQYVIIAAETGHVIQLRVQGRPLVLAALFDHDETLGKALSVARLAAEKISASLQVSMPAGAPQTSESARVSA